MWNDSIYASQSSKISWIYQPWVIEVVKNPYQTLHFICRFIFQCDQPLWQIRVQWAAAVEKWLGRTRGVELQIRDWNRRFTRGVELQIRDWNRRFKVRVQSLVTFYKCATAWLELICSVTLTVKSECKGCNTSFLAVCQYRHQEFIIRLPLKCTIYRFEWTHRSSNHLVGCFFSRLGCKLVAVIRLVSCSGEWQLLSRIMSLNQG